MIMIDDAGWGSLIGGMIVGVYDYGADRFVKGLVEPEFFQGAAFERKEYLQETVRQARYCFRQLGVSREATVEICSGHALKGIRRRLDETGYDWRETKIEGPLQNKIERAFWRYLQDIGFEVSWEEYTDPDKRGLLWWKQIEWLKGGDVDATGPAPNRAKWCKTGWGSFEIWANHPYDEAKELAAKRRRELQRRYS